MRSVISKDERLAPAFTVSGRIAKPVHEVFEAVADPKQLSGYFTTGGARGRLEAGATVTWDFHDFPGAFPVHVVDGSINFVADPTEWNGTDIIFDITPHGTGSDVRITHVGLVPQKQCFDGCSQGWDHYFGKSLPALINRLALPQTSKTEA